jgi:hypothetical protein
MEAAGSWEADRRGFLGLLSAYLLSRTLFKVGAHCTALFVAIFSRK